MKKKVLKAEAIPEFDESLASISEESKIFVDKSLEIADFIFWVMDSKGLKQKDLAEKMGKTEAEVSKLLAGMHNYTLRSIAKIEAALGTTIICTPRMLRVSFPDESIQTSSYQLIERKQEKEVSPIQYDEKFAKIIHIAGNNINQPEPIAI